MRILSTFVDQTFALLIMVAFLFLTSTFQPEKPVVKYNPPLEFWVKLYLIGHFTLLLAIFLHFEYDRSTLDYIDFSLKIAFFLVTMQCFGAFFDRK